MKCARPGCENQVPTLSNSKREYCSAFCSREHRKQKQGESQQPKRCAHCYGPLEKQANKFCSRNCNDKHKRGTRSHLCPVCRCAHEKRGRHVLCPGCRSLLIRKYVVIQCAYCREYRFMKRLTSRFCSRQCANYGRYMEPISPKRTAEAKERTESRRRCHDCGRPTDNYRCDECWQALRGEPETLEMIDFGTELRFGQ